MQRFLALLFLFLISHSPCFSNELQDYVASGRANLPALTLGESSGGITRASFSSVTWREKDVAPALWKHHLEFADEGESKDCDLAVLFITGGKLNTDGNKGHHEQLLDVKKRTG